MLGKRGLARAAARWLPALWVLAGDVSFAGDVTLTWDLNTEPELGGYTVYWGPSSANYTNSMDVGDQVTYTVTGLAQGQTYFFAVTAYDTSRTIESPYSNEVSTTIPPMAPVATFSASSVSGVAPLAVQFTNTSTGNITSWTWDLGGGATSTAQHPTHNYALPGIYNVTLTVTGPGGSDTSSVTVYACCTITLEELAVDFGADGFWSFGPDGWTHRSILDAQSLEIWNNQVVVAFGSGKGVYAFDGAYWDCLTSFDATHLVAWNDKLVLAFAGVGLWTYSSSGWTQLSSWDPEHVVAWGDKLAVAFGSGRGLWYHDGARWTSMTLWDPYGLVPWGDTLAVAFDAGRGIWRYDRGTWTQLATSQPAQMTSWGGQLAVAFGSGGGLWSHDGAAWKLLTHWDPYDLENWGTKLLASFDAGRGLWRYQNGGWAQLTASEPVDTVASGNKVYVDFGTGVGLYRYDGTTWSALTGWSSEEMVTTTKP